MPPQPESFSQIFFKEGKTYRQRLRLKKRNRALIVISLPNRRNFVYAMGL